MTTWLRRWFGGRQDGNWALEENQTATLHGGRPVLLSLERGLLIVTREGDPGDHLLRAGEALALPGRGKVVAWALEPSRAKVRDAASAALGTAPRQPHPARA
jgi:hypothetical protein